VLVLESRHGSIKAQQPSTGPGKRAEGSVERPEAETTSAMIAKTGPVRRAGSPANRGLEPHRSGLRVMARHWRVRRGGFTALPYYSPNDLDEREGIGPKSPKPQRSLASLSPVRPLPLAAPVEQTNPVSSSSPQSLYLPEIVAGTPRCAHAPPVFFGSCYENVMSMLGSCNGVVMNLLGDCKQKQRPREETLQM
jgi:hypothetical protein